MIVVEHGNCTSIIQNDDIEQLRSSLTQLWIDLINRVEKSKPIPLELDDDSTPKSCYNRVGG